METKLRAQAYTSEKLLDIINTIFTCILEIEEGENEEEKKLIVQILENALTMNK